MTTDTSQSKATGKTPPKSSPKLSAEDKSKDKFFEELAAIGNKMIAKHGSDFAMGAFVLAARFIAEGKSLSPQTEKSESCGPGCSHDHHHHDHHHGRKT